MQTENSNPSKINIALRHRQKSLAAKRAQAIGAALILTGMDPTATAKTENLMKSHPFWVVFLCFPSLYTLFILSQMAPIDALGWAPYYKENRHWNALSTHYGV